MAPTLSIVQPSCSDAYGHITVTNPDPTSGLYQFSNDNFATWNTTGLFDFAAGAGYSISVRPISNTSCTSGATECPNTGPSARIAAPGQEVTGSALTESETVLVAIPDPFSMNSTLEFRMPQSGQAMLQVFDIKGRLVSQVYNGEAEAGTTYRVALKGGDFAYGTYVARLSLNGQLLKSIRMMSQQK